MKKTGLLILLSCGMICGCSKEYIEMDILSSNNTTSGNWYELDIDVIADKDDVSDKEACSREIWLNFWAAMKVYTEGMRMGCVRYRYGHC